MRFEPCGTVFHYSLTKSKHRQHSLSDLMNNFVSFMRSSLGRFLRIALGLFLIWYGFFAGGGALLGVIGFVPLIAGAVSVCLLAPVMGYTVRGVKKAS